MTATRQQAVANAQRSTTYAVGMCARWTRERFGLPPLGDHDADGDADAVDMWKAAQLKHPGDRRPPAGVPVYWSGGSSGHGHVAVAFSEQRVRTIDRPGPGLVSTVPLSEIERAWGLTYLGWSEDLYGNEIPSTIPAVNVGPAVAAVNKAIRAAREAGLPRIVARLKRIRAALRTKGTTR